MNLPADLSERLRQRALIVSALRRSLDARGYVEVQTPLLVPGTCPDRHLRSFGVGEDYLVTSTEYQLKRLFAAGVPAAYTLGPNFREGDLSPRHNPEFTMLEWGRRQATMAEIEAEAEALLRTSAIAAGLDALPTFGRVRVRDLLVARFNTAVLSAVPGPLADDPDAHLAWALDTALSDLPAAVPTWVTHWPASMTATAGLDPDDPTTTQRSELMWRGLELADGFPFCPDASWQRARSEAENDARRAQGLPAVRQDERFLSSVGALGAGAGMALGVDRLCMALMGTSDIAEVMAFGWASR